MEKTTQKEVILNHLLNRRGLTSFEAFEKYGATRLSGIIHKLRKDGYVIYNEDIYKKNRYGTHTHFVRYWLEKDKEPWYKRIRLFM